MEVSINAIQWKGDNLKEVNEFLVGYPNVYVHGEQNGRLHITGEGLPEEIECYAYLIGNKMEVAYKSQRDFNITFSHNDPPKEEKQSIRHRILDLLSKIVECIFDALWWF